MRTREEWRSLVLYSCALAPKSSASDAIILERALDLLEQDPSLGTWHAVHTAAGRLDTCGCARCRPAPSSLMGAR